MIAPSPRNPRPARGCLYYLGTMLTLVVFIVESQETVIAYKILMPIEDNPGTQGTLIHRSQQGSRVEVIIDHSQGVRR